MFMQTDLRICSYEVDLSWTPYFGWNNLDRYEVYGRIAGEEWQLMGTTSSTTITVDVIALKDYCFFIKAISSNGSFSFSNRSCLTVIAPSEPDYHYLKVATVNGNQVDLRHLIDSSSGVTGVAFEKMDDQGVFQQISQVNVTSDNVFYTDTDVDVNKFSYTYRARVIDSCGHLGTASNIAKTILLTTQKDDVRMLTYLNWTAYTDFDGSVLAYNIYRGVDGVFATGVLASVPASQLSFQDDANDLTFMGKVCYYIEAIEGDNVYDARELSLSNISCEVFEPIVYIPNAFMPEGVNTTFIPVITNFDPREYRFTIFDRWGQVIFQTDSPIEGWSGYIPGGKMAETGTYVYMVEMHDGNGIEIIKRGHVTLLK
jgi:gliding motility-associated-like protein